MLGMEGKICKLKQLIKMEKRKKLYHLCGKGTVVLFFSKKDSLSGQVVLFVFDIGDQTQGLTRARKEF